jgi:hypothetical protein
MNAQTTEGDIVYIYNDDEVAQLRSDNLIDGTLIVYKAPDGTVVRGEPEDVDDFFRADADDACADAHAAQPDDDDDDDCKSEIDFDAI